MLQGALRDESEPEVDEIIVSFDIFGQKIVSSTQKRHIYVNSRRIGVDLSKKASELRFLDEKTLLVLERDGAASLLHLTAEDAGNSTAKLEKSFFGRSVSLVCSAGNALADKDGVVTYLKELGKRQIDKIQTFKGFIRQMSNKYVLTEKGIYNESYTILEANNIVSFTENENKLYIAQQTKEINTIVIKISVIDTTGQLIEISKFNISTPHNFDIRPDVTAVQLITTKQSEVLIVNQLEGTIHDVFGKIKSSNNVEYFKVTADIINMMCCVLVTYAANPEKYKRKS